MTTRLVTPPTGSDSASATKRRYGTVASVATDTVLADAEPLDIREFRDIAVKPSAGITGLTIHAAETEAGTYVVVDSIGTNGLVTVVAAKWNVLDTTKIGPFGWIKMVSNIDGTVSVVGKT